MGDLVSHFGGQTSAAEEVVGENIAPPPAEILWDDSFSRNNTVVRINKAECKEPNTSGFRWVLEFDGIETVLDNVGESN
jgi:hypothetical protein